MAKILVLDDHAPNREFLITLLGYVGHTMIEAATAEEALVTLHCEHPDLVIADVLMPAVDGFEFVRRLRADPLIAHTRVIFYTAAYLESEARALAEACGVLHLLTKPTEPQQIIETVQAVLGMAALAPPPPPAHEFDRSHQRLLLDKLAQKVDELESLNTELEERVASRTAELADANTRLSELVAVKDNLLAITSHDLRSPLGAIMNTAELLLHDSELSDEARQRFTHNIYSSAQFLIDMVNKLLDLSRLDAGKVELDPTLLLVSDIARQSLSSLQVSAQAKTIATELVVLPDEQPVYADGMKLLQIANNLLSNAIKFTPRGGQVVVTIGPEPEGMRMEVADNGIGIPHDTLPHLFEKFHQIHTRGTADERGTGLGLAIVRQLTKLHGGSIEVRSDTHQGTTFVVRLPYHNGAVPPGAV